MHAQRLLNVARSLRESLNPDKFMMSDYGHDCGSPACAIGHYAFRTDLQELFILAKDGDFLYAGRDSTAYDAAASYDDDRTLEHFGITEEEADELFSYNGCGLAQTANAAADYIERFVKAKWGIDPAVRKLEAGLTTERQPELCREC